MRQPAAEHVRERFEKEASSFDAIYRLDRSPFSRCFNRVFRKAIFERFEITFEQAGDVAGRTVLDVGCGSGIYAAEFAHRGAARVVGVDFSSNMVKLARAEADLRGVSGVCEFIEADFLDLEIRETFDVAYAMGVFDYLPEPEGLLCKMAGVTRGKVIASFPGHSLLREPARRLRYRLTGRGDVHFYHEGEVQDLARAARFADFRIIPIHSSGSGFILVGRCTA
jgi:ubiquinone/menaquinone biosynthesis C-methylase UbiE